MTEETILRPTQQRISKADHVADDGVPTKERPYVRAMRLGDAWTRYCRDRDAKTGRVLADHEMTLKRHQIAAGDLYLQHYAKGLWGGPVMSKMEASSRMAGPTTPAAALDNIRAIWRAEEFLMDYERLLLQLVLIDGLSAEEWATRTKRHPRSGIEILRNVLDRLAVHFNLIKYPLDAKTAI